jgi:copper homeostasis protein
MSEIVVEACVDSVAGSIAAERGGAGRIELCDALFDGGTTPSAGMISACKEAVSIPVFVMIRSRGGGFQYSESERDVMLRDVIAARELGADGIVTGALLSDNTIDLETVRLLGEAAGDCPVTFHKAFDLTPDLCASLDLLIDAGVNRVLTSGGAAAALDGVPKLAELVRRAGSGITVIAGGGVRQENVEPIVAGSGVREVHVRLTRLMRDSSASPPIRLRKALPDDDLAWEETDEARVRSFVETLRKSPHS